MKFRPHMQLRFRSEAQYDALKAKAASSQSINEWILEQIEKLNPDLAEGVMVEPTTKVRAKTQPKAELKKKGSKKDEATPCPYCKGINVKPWGSQRRCEDCKRNIA